MEKIVITGATGNLGKSTINFLLKKGVSPNKISALVRDEAKSSDLKNQGIELKMGDYDNYSSLLTAFRGADKLFFVSGSDIPNRKKQHENVIKAAKEAGVKHIIYTSFQRKNETETSPIALLADAHISTEAWLKESEISYTILKNNIYMDVLPLFIGDKLFETGVIYQPAGDGKTAYTLRDDMAEVVAHILTSKGHENKEYDITAEKSYSYHEIALMISEITGKSVTYVSPSVAEFTKTLSDAGVPMEYINLFAGFSEAGKQGEFENTASTIEQLIGRKPTSLKDYLTQVYSAK